jgi:hypothetical protein
MRGLDVGQDANKRRAPPPARVSALAQGFLAIVGGEVAMRSAKLRTRCHDRSTRLATAKDSGAERMLLHDFIMAELVDERQGTLACARVRARTGRGSER